MEEMKNFGFSPCVIAYTTLIEACCLEKDFRMVDAILQEMCAHGCQPNVVTYTIIMHSLGKAKEIQEAFMVFEKMKDNGCAPDISFYNSLIYILGKAGRVRDAKDIYQEMRKTGISPNVNTFNTLISASCDHFQVENAVELLFSMQEINCKPNIKTYIPLFKLCFKQKWVKILFYLLGHMFKKDIGIDLSTYNLLVCGLCRNDKVDLSCLFFEEMVLKGFVPKQRTYNILIEKLGRKNMSIAKLKVQRLMLQAENMKAPSFHPVDKQQCTK